ncbi:hypothetical protein C5167_045123 [Papaver somniferum]|uniref:Uncharacterized protein n=1 Tax=Papaver somniferum TaxID=3469 RepID=A0A4Y7LBG0_PAPSO|nr:hypothetical protein C5167_045123 [Papaver somniferum]
MALKSIELWKKKKKGFNEWKMKMENDSEYRSQHTTNFAHQVFEEVTELVKVQPRKSMLLPVKE